MEGASTLRDLPNVKISKDAIAIRIPNETDDTTCTDISYGTLTDLVKATATALCEEARLGNVPGTIVSIVMPNCVPFVLSFLAVPWSRSVSAPLNENYTEAEYKFYMEDNKSKLLLVPDGDGIPAAEAAADALGLSVYRVGYNLETGQVTVSHKDGTPARVDFSTEKEEKYNFNPQPSDVTLFLHTSGTTAKPKGVPLTHGNLVASMNNIATTYRLTPADSVLLIMPLFHVHGLMSALLTTLATGGTVILPPQLKFSASNFWHNATVGRATWVTCVPTIYQVLLLRFDQDYPKENAPQFRFVRSCSSALAPSVLAKVEEKFNAPCVEAYAMTEASHQMCSNPIDGPRKAGTVGKGTGVAVAILDASNQVVNEPNVEGEVCIRGKNVTSGYIGVSDEVNKEAFAGGWFHTGDQGKLDEDGYLTLTGRIKELINRGGEKISPLEVDAAMLAHPAVAEAVSFAMPDEKYGELVAAAIILKEGETLDEAGLKEFLTDKLSSFKVPVKVFFDEKLPKTATGKIQRRIVAAHFLPK
jgi:acyl-CoA synthetase (AMP-forming)/AMP-acid ligase II